LSAFYFLPNGLDACGLGPCVPCEKRQVMAESGGSDDSIRHVWNSLSGNLEDCLGDILIDRSNNQSRGRIPALPCDWRVATSTYPVSFRELDVDQRRRADGTGLVTMCGGGKRAGKTVNLPSRCPVIRFDIPGVNRSTRPHDRSTLNFRLFNAFHLTS